MALVKCKSCGRLVSDKASECPGCGTSINKKVICEECGEEYSYYLSSCPTCGCPNEAKVSNTESNINYQSTQSSTDSKENTSSYNLEQRVQDFLIFNQKYLPEKDLEYVASRLLNLTKSQIFDVECLPFRNVTAMYLVSIFLGVLGVDRFLLTDARNGVFKLLLFIFSFLIIPGIILLVWWLKDIIRMDTMTREFNLQLLETACDYYAIS